MIIQRAFEEKDISNIDPIDNVTDEVKEGVKSSPSTWTILSGDIPVCIWGKVHIWDGRAIIWSMMGVGSRSCMRGIIRHSLKTIEQFDETRIEATVRSGFHPGCRLLEILGFSRECLMKKFSKFGDDEYLYARVS